MPSIAYFHPQIVHFVIAMLFVGVIARVVSVLPLGKLGRKLSWAGPMAALLIVLGTIASAAAVKSGDAAHGPAERVPGARDAVVEHEEAGEWARNVFFVVAALELLALGLSGKPAVAKGLRIGSAAAGLAGLFALYEAAEHGGELVYAYAGGVGIRSGDSTDVTRLLVAGLYHNVQADRRAGRKEDAARLVDELARRMPGDASVRWMVLESRITDRGDAAGALLALDSITPAADDRRGRIQKAMLTSQALEAVGNRDSAAKVLDALATEFPQMRARVEESITRLRAPAPEAPAQPTP
jgi:uncharacterized membrane protein